MEIEGLTFYQAISLINSMDRSDLTLIEPKRLPREPEGIALPKGVYSVSDEVGILGKRARAYLESRGFDLKELDSIGIGYCTERNRDDAGQDYFGRIIIPFLYRGRLQYFIARSFIGSQPKYKNPPKEVTGVGKADILFNQDALDLYDEVFVLEGAIDALTLGKKSVASMGWSLSKKQERLMLMSQVQKFVFVPDPGFYQKALKTAMRFIDHKQVYVLNLDREQGDVNVVGKDRVMSIYRQTKPLTRRDAVDLMNKFV
jgi:DNA primase